jgi:hypothetical protein
MVGRLVLAKRRFEARQAAEKGRIKLLRWHVEGQEATQPATNVRMRILSKLPDFELTSATGGPLGELLQRLRHRLCSFGEPKIGRIGHNDRPEHV